MDLYLYITRTIQSFFFCFFARVGLGSGHGLPRGRPRGRAPFYVRFGQFEFLLPKRRRRLEGAQTVLGVALTVSGVQARRVYA